MPDPRRRRWNPPEQFAGADDPGCLAFAAAGGPAVRLVPFVEEVGALLSLLVWLMFGVVAVAPALAGLTWQTALYAVLSLTVIRMLPVAVALWRAGLGRPAVLFIGWFGPRGLASVVFGLLALEDMAARHGARLALPPGPAGLAGLGEIPERRLIRRSWPAGQAAPGPPSRGNSS